MKRKRMGRWGKRASNGCPLPVRCPLCGSRKTMLSTYSDGSMYVECEGCYNVIAGPMVEDRGGWAVEGHVHAWKPAMGHVYICACGARKARRYAKMGRV